MLHAINRVHTGWLHQSFMYTNEHIYVYKKNIFYLKWYLNPELSVIKLLKIRLYKRLRVDDKRRLLLVMLPGCLGTKAPRS